MLYPVLQNCWKALKAQEQSTDNICDRTACAESSLAQQWQLTKKDSLSLNKEKHKRTEDGNDILRKKAHTEI